MTEAFRPIDVTRVRGGARTADVDRAATEEPLEIRLHGQPFAVIMRTPGADRELAAGFLLAERVIAGADDLGTIKYCTDPQGVPDVGARGVPASAREDVDRASARLAEAPEARRRQACPPPPGQP